VRCATGSTKRDSERGGDRKAGWQARTFLGSRLSCFVTRRQLKGTCRGVTQPILPNSGADLAPERAKVYEVLRGKKKKFQGLKCLFIPALRGARLPFEGGVTDQSMAARMSRLVESTWPAVECLIPSWWCSSSKPPSLCRHCGLCGALGVVQEELSGCWSSCCVCQTGWPTLSA
jgi:hypothetical protein